MFPNTEFVFDIELPVEFVPKNNDGEVDEFKLVPATELVRQICDSNMKTTSCPVTLDFLIRKGIVNSESGKITLVWRFKILHSKLVNQNYSSLSNKRDAQLINFRKNSGMTISIFHLI